MQTRHPLIHAAWGLALVAALSACSSGDPTATDTPASTPAGGAQRAPNPAGDMVKAVPIEREEGPLELKFELSKRPQVNDPLEIRFALIPRSPLEEVLATFQADEGLELRAGAEMQRIEQPVPGTPVTHTVTLVPRREGIFTVTAVVMTDGADQALARSYAVPLIVGPTQADGGSSL